MNLILLNRDDYIDADTAILRDRRHQQIWQTHKAQAGDSVRVGQLNGQIGSARIEAIDAQQVVLRVTLQQQPPAKLPLTVVLALPRPKVIRRILRSLAELGVARLYLIQTYKVEKSYWQSPLIEEERISEYLLDGLQQSGDTMLPEVHLRRRFKPFVEDELPGLIQSGLALLAHPRQGEPCPHALNQALTLAIGPEGGFTDYEVDKLLAAGFSGIQLGPRILKVENALVALIAKLYD